MLDDFTVWMTWQPLAGGLSKLIFFIFWRCVMATRKSAKVTRLFTGYDTFGRQIEVAQADTGHWYCRSWGYNGHGYAWTKWENHNPEWTERGTMDWGFNHLGESQDLSDIKYRLPLDEVIHTVCPLATWDRKEEEEEEEESVTADSVKTTTEGTKMNKNGLIATIKTLLASKDKTDLIAAIKKAELGFNAVKDNASLSGFKKGQLLAQYRSLRNQALKKLVELAKSLKITLVIEWLEWSGKFTAFSSEKKQEYLSDILTGKVKQFSITI